MRRALGALILALLALPATAAAQSATIERAAQALQSDPVYVDASAPEADKVDAAELRRRISNSGAAPMYIAVLPAVGQPANTVAHSLFSATGRDGAYVVVAGRRLGAGASDLHGVLGQARAASRDHPHDVQAALDDLVDRVGRLRAGAGSASGGGGGGGSGAVLAIVLLVIVAAGGALLLVSRKRRRAREAEELAGVKENARDDLIALGEDIRALDLDVQMPNAPAAAKEDYARAVDCYDRANSIFELARSPEDLAPAAAALEEGRYAMASAKARLEGREPPDRRPPCFFDPRHGPSSREVEWAPPGGAPRLVPACEADAQRVERGDDPEARELLLGGQRVPYWQAGPMYAPFYGGFFGGGGGFLGGMLAGTLLGEALSPGWGYDPGWDDGGGWGNGGDGDFGGDWGGGDAGDFGGGGDVGGGGDFGGGDAGGF